MKLKSPIAKLSESETRIGFFPDKLNSEKWIWIGLIVVSLGVIAYYVYTEYFNKDEQDK